VTAPPTQTTQQQAPPVLPQQPQQASVAPTEEAHFGDLLRQGEYTSNKAQSARDTESCPECGGPNYLAEKGKPNSMKHCFDCGANPRFSQSMAGVSGTGQNIPVKTARSQQMNNSTYDPSVIVGHV
jgi:membrane protease subunit (stomatin/prohibitin family)